MPSNTRSALLMSALALAVVLSAAPPAHAGKADRKAADAPARAFIETSYLIAPERVGDFVLEGASYDDKNKFAGAGFRYALEGHQETRFDVYVYPVGRAPQAQAIADGMADFKSSIEQAQQGGIYKDLEYLSEDDFPLQAPEPETAAQASPDAKAQAAPKELDAALLEALASTRIVGKRLRMRNVLVNGGFPMYSNGYLFHRQLYYFKVRASATRDRIDQAQFDALTDRAARELVPAIEVANIGGCANRTIEIDTNASADDMAVVLVRHTAEIQGENCFTDAADAKLEKKSKGARVVRIDFDPSIWKSE